MARPCSFGHLVPLLGIVLALLVAVVGGRPAAAQERSTPQERPTPKKAQRPMPEDEVDRKAKSLLVRGLTETFLEDYDEAVSYFEKALAVAPREPAILSAMSEAEAGRDNVTSALYYARQARNRGQHPYYHQSLAELLRSANRPQDAVTVYKALLDSFPDQPAARRALARLQAEMGQTKAALRTYEALVDSTDRPQPAAVYDEMLQLYEQVGDQQGQERVLKTLLQRRQSTRAYRKRLADLYVEQERYEEALPLYEKLLRKTPNAPGLLSRLKMLYDKTGRMDEAEALWQRFSAAEASPDQQVRRARSLYEDARRSAAPLDSTAVAPAVALLRSALDADSTHVRALDLLGTLYYEIGTYAEAASILQRAIDEDPRKATRWDRAATAHLKAGQPAQAIAVAEEGRLLFPGRPGLLRTLAAAKLQLNEHDAALTYFQKAIDKLGQGGPDSTRAALYAGLGRAHGRLGHTQQSDEAFETALRLDPNQPTALTFFAVHLANREEELKRAFDLAQRAVSERPTDPAALGALGWVQFKRERPTEAKASFQKALDADRVPAWVYEKFGDFHRSLGNAQLAQRYWTKALDRSPARDTLQKKLDTLPER